MCSTQLLSCSPYSRGKTGTFIFWFSSLNSFHNGCRGLCVGQVLPSLNGRGDKSLSQLLKEHSPLAFLPWHPGRVDLLPCHKGIVSGHISDVIDDDQGPVCSLHSVAVCSNNLVEVAHAPFVAVVIEDDGWFLVVMITDFSCLVLRAQQCHVLVNFWKIRKKWWCDWRQTLIWLLCLCCGECRWEFRLILANSANHGHLLFQELLAELLGGEKIITCDVVPAQSNCQLNHNPHPMVLSCVMKRSKVYEMSWTWAAEIPCWPWSHPYDVWCCCSSLAAVWI